MLNYKFLQLQYIYKNLYRNINLKVQLKLNYAYLREKDESEFAKEM